MVLEDFKEAPRALKVLVGSALIENMAFGLVIPFLAIYMKDDLEISMPLIGVVMAGYTLAGMPSMIIGGMLADRIGRKTVLIASLGLMSVAMLMYFYATSFVTMFIVAFTDSFVGTMYMPAANAMIADVTPPEKRPKAFSMLRIAWNVGIIFGPVIGALLVVTYPLKVLFVFGSGILAVAFVVNLILIPETKPDVLGETITLKSVLSVRKDHPFLLLCVLSGIFWFFFSQWISVLPIYAFEDIGITKDQWALLFAASAILVVTLQLWVTSRVMYLRRSLPLISGQMVAAAGFALIFLANDFNTLLACIVVITLGEIIYMSVVSTVIADMSPESRRGIYMGFAGFVQIIAQGAGFLFGMSLLDALTERSLIWLVFGAIGAVSCLGYVLFSRVVPKHIENPKPKSDEQTATGL